MLGSLRFPPATCSNGSPAMAQIPVSFAWGNPSVFEVNGAPVWGCQFELLPGGSMMNATCILLGVVGQPASLDDDGAEPIYRTVPGGNLAIWSTADTEPSDLVPFQEEILQSYREHMQRMGMRIGA